MVVGSGRGDAPKYVGEGGVLCRTPSALGLPLSHNLHHLWPF